jgi:hypothetical protein
MAWRLEVGEWREATVLVSLCGVSMCAFVYLGFGRELFGGSLPITTPRCAKPTFCVCVHSGNVLGKGGAHSRLCGRSHHCCTSGRARARSYCISKPSHSVVVRCGGSCGWQLLPTVVARLRRDVAKCGARSRWEHGTCWTMRCPWPLVAGLAEIPADRRPLL